MRPRVLSSGFYQFRENPFALTPEHRACFKHPSFVAAKRGLVSSLQARGGITILTGAPGTGKTTLMNDIISRLSPAQVSLGCVVTTQLQAPDLLRAVAFSFGLDGTGVPTAVLLRSLQRFWTEQSRRRRRVVLIVDEAQGLEACAGRMLGSLAAAHASGSAALNLILAGDLNPEAFLNASPLARLAAPTSARIKLQPLNTEEVGGYVRHRLVNQGWRNEPSITGQALILISHHSGGIPAAINLICRRLLLCGAVERKRRLHIEEVHQVLAELRTECLLPACIGSMCLQSAAETCGQVCGQQSPPVRHGGESAP